MKQPKRKRFELDSAPEIGSSPELTNELCNRLLNSTSFLEGEGETQYHKDFEALFAETKPVSFLDVTTVRDYADKLQDDRRSRAALKLVIDGRKVSPALPKKLRQAAQEAGSADRTLEKYHLVSRMQDANFKARRLLEKDLRRMMNRASKPSATDQRDQ